MSLSLSVENLTCARGGRVLFSGLSFGLAGGQALSVEGANGAGKTSLLRLVAGFLTPQSGTLALNLDGRAVGDAEERGRFVGWFGHQDGLKPQLTVLEQLAFFLRLYRSDASPGDLLARVGLSRQADLPCRYLSAGQKRRLALARLLAGARPLWLLDEPFAALDREGQALIGDAMARHCAGGGIVIAATHDALNVRHESLKL